MQSNDCGSLNLGDSVYSVSNTADEKSSVSVYEPAVKKSRLDEDQLESTEKTKLDIVMEEDKSSNNHGSQDEDMGIRKVNVAPLNKLVNKTNTTDSRRKKAKTNGMVDFWRMQNASNPPPERLFKGQSEISQQQYSLFDLFTGDMNSSSRLAQPCDLNLPLLAGNSGQPQKNYKVLCDEPSSSRLPTRRDLSRPSTSFNRQSFSPNSWSRVEDYSLTTNAENRVDRFDNNRGDATFSTARREALFGSAAQWRLAGDSHVEEHTQQLRLERFMPHFIPHTHQYINIRQSNIIPDRELEVHDYNDDSSSSGIEDYSSTNEISMEDDVFVDQINDMMKAAFE